MRKFISGILAVILFGLSALAWAATVNINTADAKAIAANLKGIGLKRAEAIVAYRTHYGAFKSIDELAKVKGIGKKTVELNKANISLGDNN